MPATLIAPTQPSPAPGASPTAARLRKNMLAAGWSPDEIQTVQRALTAVRIHDNYLRAGYSPDEIERIVSLY